MITYTIRPDDPPSAAGNVVVLLLPPWSPFRPWFGLPFGGITRYDTLVCRPTAPPLWRLFPLAAAGRPFLGVFGPDGVRTRLRGYAFTGGAVDALPGLLAACRRGDNHP